MRNQPTTRSGIQRPASFQPKPAHSAAMPRTNAAGQRMKPMRLRCIPQAKSVARALPDSPLFGRKPRTGRVSRARPISRRVVAGNENHCRWVRGRGKLLRDRETIEAGQLDVEQHDLRSELRRRVSRVRQHCRLPHRPRRSPRLERVRGGRPKVGMVVDDDQGRTHVLIVPHEDGRS